MSTDVSELHLQKASARSRFFKLINDPNLIVTVLFCLLGLLVTAAVMLRFPNLGAIIAQYNQF